MAETFHVLGCILRFKSRPSEGDPYLLVDGLFQPGTGAPPNRHPQDNERFYVLEGTFEFTVGNTVRKFGPGDVIAIPDGEFHAFTKIGEGVGRLIIVNSPGHVHEAFFSENGVGEPLPEGTETFPPMSAPDVPKLIAIGERCGLEFTAPPGK